MSNFSIALTPRDRKILLWAIPLVVILVSALWAKKMFAEREVRNDDLKLVLEDIAWLQAQTDTMTALKQGCSSSPWNGGTLQRLASRYRVSLSGERTTDKGVEMNLDAGNGNDVIALLQALECSGAVVETLSLETLDEQGAVKGRVVLRLPVT